MDGSVRVNKEKENSKEEFVFRETKKEFNESKGIG